MDEGLEQMLYGVVRRKLPETIIVSVSHRSTVHPFHDSHLELIGDGDWRLERLARSG
jgi:putative ATP-binding cassette transporter